MMKTILLISLALFMIAIALHLVRVIKGPSMPDRAIALDTIGVNLISSMAIISLLLETTAFLEAILILGILAFIGTIAFSKYIERGVIIERKSDH
ncbi:Na(+)/H(+) antiporter subunit F1 [Ureibacillus sp. FSL K6-8385]|uniref:Na(+)/H(+) antiporter subunit F1 n=1 Tax=Ureibacillus terrenus TaxID=118246 RepID=A0A540UZ44_9BACL|nr:Na(+)/H(+) antiporter subunit F1 [Ureibacillus terrenus]MED3662124.1 Na(+)/H(+) antiporter subunit F1 [Ureibacillus terrenus]MED3764462.1 Na(+)/H(+) antiporter subunit F1 [Ureibacillus terrenus]TQE89771.1 Na(+)/H(+) antiporter subunit F1 [Ureibacillus terrenus]